MPPGAQEKGGKLEHDVALSWSLIVADAIRNDTRSLSVQYDLTLGFPTRIALGDPAVDAPVYVMSDLRAR